MKAFARIVACAATAVFTVVAVGCDNHAAPAVDTASTTSADMSTLSALEARDAGGSVSIEVAPPPAVIEIEVPVVRAPPENAAVPAAHAAPAPVVPAVLPAPTGAATATIRPNDPNGATGGDAPFVGSSFGAPGSNP